jgi:hypothetical protein
MRLDGQVAGGVQILARGTRLGDVGQGGKALSKNAFEVVRQEPSPEW